MFYGDVSDSRLSTFLRRYISQHEPNEVKLNNLKFCGSHVARQMGAVPAVYVLADRQSEKSFTFGHSFCHSCWSCPHCAPVAMAKRGADIACAIDALAKQGQYAFMLTFTLPHIGKMSINESYTILLDTWRAFTNPSRREKQYILKGDSEAGSAGEKRVYKLSGSPLQAFKSRFDIKHFVRVYEFTYGKENGWHPHIHALFWTDKKNFAHLLEYRDMLISFWWYCARKSALKYWNKTKPNRDNVAYVDSFYADWRKYPRTGHRSVYFSVDEKGNVIVQKSSYYIAGWSGDNELTGVKTARAEGHFSPFQLLEKAYLAKKNGDLSTLHDLMWEFLEYAKVTWNRRRFALSKGLNQIIADWRKTQDYIMSFKKKDMQRKEKACSAKVVYWFNELQWNLIYFTDRTTDHMLLPKILEFALLKHAQRAIYRLLKHYGIPPDLDYSIPQSQIQLISERFSAKNISA